MRLISQDGTIDVPYENSAVVITGSYIRVEFGGAKSYPMAHYSGEERIDEVVGSLYRTIEAPQMEDGNYLYLNGVFRFPEDNEVDVDAT